METVFNTHGGERDQCTTQNTHKWGTTSSNGRVVSLHPAVNSSYSYTSMLQAEETIFFYFNFLSSCSLRCSFCYTLRVVSFCLQWGCSTGWAKSVCWNMTRRENCKSGEIELFITLHCKKSQPLWIVTFRRKREREKKIFFFGSRKSFFNILKFIHSSFRQSSNN